MRVFLTYFIVLSICFSYTSCKKEEKTDHKNLIVYGNTPPPYSGISSILIENYVTKLHIDLIGLKPDDITKNESVTYLVENNLSLEAREKVAGDIIALDAYHDRLFQINSDLLLGGMGYDDIQSYYNDYAGVRDFLYQSGDTFTAQYFDNELLKVQAVLDVSSDYKAGTINLNEYFRRMCFNLIYDEINMGSENFVKSCFENFFKRQPTAEELENGVNMVDGQSMFLLRKEGRNKTDFLNIMTTDSEFYQGRVVDAFRTLLLRDASSAELALATENFIKSDNYKIMQIDITKTDEYAGFE